MSLQLHRLLGDRADRLEVKDHGYGDREDAGDDDMPDAHGGRAPLDGHARPVWGQLLACPRCGFGGSPFRQSSSRPVGASVYCAVGDTLCVSRGLGARGRLVALHHTLGFSDLL